MWQANKRRSGLYVHVGSTQVQAALYVSGAWQTESLLSVPIASVSKASDFDSWEPLAKALELMNQIVKPMLSKWSKEKLSMHVVVAHAWIEQATLPWTNELAAGVNAASIRTALSAQMGLIDAHDLVNVEVSAWQEPCWAVVYKQRLMELLQSSAQALNLVWEALLPEAAVVSTAVKANTQAQFVCGYVVDQTLLMVEVRKGKVHAVLQRPMPGGKGLDALAQVWLGVSLRSPHWQEQKLVLLKDTDINDSVAHDALRLQAWPLAAQISIPCMLRALFVTHTSKHSLNAVNTSDRGIIVTTLPLLLMSLLLVGLGGKWFLDEQRLKQLRMSSVSIQQTASSQKPSNSLNKSQLDQMAASNAAIRQLNLPVAQLLTALQAPKDIRVALLGVDLNDAGSDTVLPKLRVNAEALTGEDAARYVAFLSDRKPFVSAYMVRHEIQQNTPEKAWRFTMELTWQP